MCSSIDNGGSGPLVVFWTIFLYILAQQGENLAWEPFLLFRGLRAPIVILGGTLVVFWSTSIAWGVVVVFFWLPLFWWCNRGRPFGATRLPGASFLYQGVVFWRRWAPLFWWRAAQQGSLVFVPLGPFFGATLVQPAPFLYRGGALLAHNPSRPSSILAHTPSRPSPILGRLWRVF